MKLDSQPEKMVKAVGALLRAEAEETFAVYVDAGRDGLLIGGAHSDDGWCWCQPEVTYPASPCGHFHPYAEHKYVADQSNDLHDPFETTPARC